MIGNMHVFAGAQLAAENMYDYTRELGLCLHQ